METNSLAQIPLFMCCLIRLNEDGIERYDWDLDIYAKHAVCTQVCAPQTPSLMYMAAWYKELLFTAATQLKGQKQGKHRFQSHSKIQCTILYCAGFPLLD